MSEATLTVDTSRWPLVVLALTGSPTEPQLEAHLREIEDEVLARRERFVQIIDMARGELPEPSQRALIAEHQTRMDYLYRRYCLGEAYVGSRAKLGAMVAVFWFATPPYPYCFVSTLDEATSWAKDRLKEAGLQAP